MTNYLSPSINLYIYVCLSSNFSVYLSQIFIILLIISAFRSFLFIRYYFFSKSVLQCFDRGVTIMNPSSSGKYFQDFDKFLQKQGGKCSSSSAATASSSYSSSSSSSRTVFDERFSSQFDIQFGQPLRRPPLTSSDKSSSLKI